MVRGGDRLNHVTDERQSILADTIYIGSGSRLVANEVVAKPA